MRFNFYLRYANLIYLFIGFFFVREWNSLLKEIYNFIILSYKYIKK